MSSSSLICKREIDVEIKASPQKFHEIFRHRPHHVSNICPDKVQGCVLHEGAWGTVGSIICWTYVHDGEVKTAKQVVEALDSDKNSITLNVFEGDVMKEFKTFVATIQATPKSEGEGSIVRWTIVYEKLHPGIAHPETLFEFFVAMSKDIDAHLIQGN